MTLAQVKALIIGILKGWFSNKEILDGLDEDENGNLIYNDEPIRCESYTDEQVTQAVTEALTELNADEAATE